MNTCTTLQLRASAWLCAWRTTLTDRLAVADERGEGVISMAIAILIVAFLGAAAWLAFKGLLDDTKAKAEVQLNKVGG